MSIFLIGGGEIGRKSIYETEEIDKRIIKETGDPHPTLLFIGLASAFSDSYYDTIKKNYKNLGCNTIYLKRKNIINNPDIVEEKFQNANIIYIGGGDTIKLLEEIKGFHLEKYLKKSLENNCVIAGISAGAILLSKEGFSDSFILRGESNHYKMVKGLEFSNLSICPHFENNSEKEEELKEFLKKESKEIYALENNTALIIKSDKIEPFKTNHGNIYHCYYKNNEYYKEEV